MPLVSHYLVRGESFFVCIACLTDGARVAATRDAVLYQMRVVMLSERISSTYVKIIEQVIRPAHQYVVSPATWARLFKAFIGKSAMFSSVTARRPQVIEHLFYPSLHVSNLPIFSSQIT